MMSSNDNRPPADSSRSLPILGKVDPRGAIVLYTSAPRSAPDDRGAAVIDFPNDPRET
jgi:hypothetical protein